MAEVMKSRRLVNPGRRNAGKKRLTWAQKLHFGTKRQRSAAMARMSGKRHNPSSKSIQRKTRHNLKQAGYKSLRYGKPVNRAKILYKNKRSVERGRYSKAPVFRQSNVGEIITIRPLSNTGTKSKSTRKGRRNNPTMAKSRKRRLAGLKAARTRKRRGTARRTRRAVNPGVRRHRRRTTIVYRAATRRRRRNPGTGVSRVHRRRHIRRRRNPGFSSSTGSFSKAIEVIAGAIVTGFAMGFVNSFSPTLNSGIPGYVATAVVAVLQGKAIGKLLKNPSLGNNMTTGGFVYLALRVAKDFSVNLPIGLQGLGLIGPSSFWTPQVNVNGSMGQFVQPTMLRQAVAMAAPPASGMHGVNTTRRVGRMR